jgi:cytochrome bd-type quinol oxidase subunit 2
MNLTEVWAAVFAVTTALVVAFQLALASGAPWGTYAMGGAFPGRMPAPMRAAAVVQSAVLIGLGIVVLSGAGLVASDLVDAWPWLIWVPVAVSGVAVVLNASTRSRGERRIWLPVALILLACSLGVALGPNPAPG